MQCPLCGVEASIRLHKAADGATAEQEFSCRCRSCENYGRVIARRKVEIRQAEEKPL